MSTALGQTSALTISGLQTKFHTPQGELTAVDGIDLTVPRGSIVGLVGESGCGKSVTALSVLGLVPAGGQVTAGEICFQGRDLRQLSEKERRKLRGDRLAMIFQDPMTSLTRMSSPRQKIYNFFCSFSGSFIAAHSCFKWVFTVILPFRIP